MRLMKLPPSVFHVALVAELAGSRRTPEIDERRIRSVAKFDQSGVDAFNLYRAGGVVSPSRRAFRPGVPAQGCPSVAEVTPSAAIGDLKCLTPSVSDTAFSARWRQCARLGENPYA